MKKLFNLSFALALLASPFLASLEANAFGRSACEPVVKECYDCAPNKPERIVTLEKCALKDKPYNYYTWTPRTVVEVNSEMYDWQNSPTR